MINTHIFDSQLLSDGHLSCPKEFAQRKNAQFKVLVVFEELAYEATNRDIEQAAVLDNSNEYLLQEELNYYMKLEEI